MHAARDVLGFWFGAPRGARRAAWFAKDPRFDAEVRARFLAPCCAALQGALAGWERSADEALALIVLTDQLPRNMFRATPQAFAGDPLALDAAKRLVASGRDRHLLPVERMFAYLPFEHSEVLEDQERALELFAPLGAFVETADTPDYARRHWDIIKRFGRFPHRNALLGRAGTPEEIEFLRQPGSGF